jgi:hypothetical protein
MLGMRGVGQKTPCPDAVRTGRLKTSRLTTNATLICVLSFRARFGTKIGLLVMCTDNGRILLVILLQRSRSTFSWGSFLSFFAFKDGILDTQISALGG